MKKAIIGVACLSILSPIANATESFSKINIYNFKESILLEAETHDYVLSQIENYESFEDIEDVEANEENVGARGKIKCSLRYQKADRHNYISPENEYVVLSTKYLESAWDQRTIKPEDSYYFAVTLLPKDVATNSKATSNEVSISQIQLLCNQEEVYKYQYDATPDATLTNWFPQKVTKVSYSKRNTGDIDSAILSEIQDLLFDAKPVKDLSEISVPR